MPAPQSQRVLLEFDLLDYGDKSDAPIATFIKRLTCRACGNSTMIRPSAGRHAISRITESSV